MAAIDKLMKRMGFVKLSEYGLVLTPEDRVISTRSAVLDDGFGGRIVGWRDGDLAAAELEKWEGTGFGANPSRRAPPDAPPRLVASPAPVAVTAPAPVTVVAPAPAPAPASVAVAAPVPEPVAVAAPAPAAISVPNVAPPPVVEEDDWEWTIAMARARAAADLVESSAPMARSSLRRIPAATVPPVVSANPEPIAHDDWGATEIEPERPAPGAREVTPSALRGGARGSLPSMSGASPSTVIPVPMLPTMATTRSTYLEPVVRSQPSPLVPLAPRRFASGTGRHHPHTISATRHTDETVPRLVIDPPREETVTVIAVPPAAARPLPSIKRASHG